jgi:hypothetical protein
VLDYVYKHHMKTGGVEWEDLCANDASLIRAIWASTILPAANAGAIPMERIHVWSSVYGLSLHLEVPTGLRPGPI